MPLSKYQRKEKLDQASVTQRELAEDLNEPDWFVSLVMNDRAVEMGYQPERIRRAQDAIAQKIGVPVDEAFPPAVEDAV